MNGKFEAHNFTQDGKPAGGTVRGIGLSINWQDGPMVDPQGRRLPPNGAFVGTVLEVVAQRLAYYQTTEFACTANSRALEHVKHAWAELATRTAEREARGVEGTHRP